jgi:hypothetical protein
LQLDRIGRLLRPSIVSTIRQIGEFTKKEKEFNYINDECLEQLCGTDSKVSQKNDKQRTPIPVSIGTGNEGPYPSGSSSLH